MSIDWRMTLRTARIYLRGATPPALPPQHTLWGWVRAALAFQPAHGRPLPVDDILSHMGQVRTGVTARSEAPVLPEPRKGWTPADADRETVGPEFRHGCFLLATGRYAEAVTVFSSVLEAASDDAVARASRAAAYRMLGQNDHAIRDATEAVRLQDDLAWAYATRGAIHRLQKNYGEALRDLDKAIALQPDYEWCIAGRGETYRLLGQSGRALADLNRALELNPRNDWALMCRGAVHLDAQEDQMALRAFREAVNVNPDGDWALGLGALTYRLMGKDLTPYVNEAHDTEPATQSVMVRRQPEVHITPLMGGGYRVEVSASLTSKVVSSVAEVLTEVEEALSGG